MHLSADISSVSSLERTFPGSGRACGNVLAQGWAEASCAVTICDMCHCSAGMWCSQKRPQVLDGG